MASPDSEVLRLVCIFHPNLIKLVAATQAYYEYSSIRPDFKAACDEPNSRLSKLSQEIKDVISTQVLSQLFSGCKKYFNLVLSCSKGTCSHQIVKEKPTIAEHRAFNPTHMDPYYGQHNRNIKVARQVFGDLRPRFGESYQPPWREELPLRNHWKHAMDLFKTTFSLDYRSLHQKQNMPIHNVAEVKKKTLVRVMEPPEDVEKEDTRGCVLYAMGILLNIDRASESDGVPRTFHRSYGLGRRDGGLYIKSRDLLVTSDQDSKLKKVDDLFGLVGEDVLRELRVVDDNEGARGKLVGEGMQSCKQTWDPNLSVKSPCL